MERMTLQAQAMKSMGLRPDLIVSSRLTRAIQTAEIVGEGLGISEPLVTMESLSPGANPHSTLEHLNSNFPLGATVMIVGHEPHLSSFISVATAGSLDPIVRMRKGALCKLRASRSAFGHSCSIEWSLTAGQMLRMLR